MKIPKDDVFRLIQAMTPAEKRYFKRHFVSGPTVQTDLFDFLNAQKTYQEAKVKEYFGGKVAKNLKVYKNQLQKQLLKSLTAFHAKRNVSSKIRLGLEEADILLEKNLFDMAREVLGRVKEQCILYEEYPSLLEILMREYRLQHTNIDKPGISGHPVFEELESVLCHFRNHLRLLRLATELIERNRSEGEHPLTEEERRAFRRIKEEDLFGDCPPPPSFREQVSRNVVLMLVSELLGEREAGGVFRRNNVELFDAYPQFKTAMSFQYLGVLRNYLNYCLEVGPQEEGLSIIEQARKVIRSNPRLEPHEAYLLEAELRIALDQGRLAYITADIEEKVLAFVDHNHSQGERICLHMFLLLGLAHIAQGNSRQAQYYLRLLHENAQGSLGDLFSELIDILDMISHFESNDEFLVSNMLNAIHRRHRDKQGLLFVLIQDLFREMIRTPERRRELVEAFLHQIEAFRQPGELALQLEYFRIKCWFEAMARGETLKKALQSRH